MPVPVFDQPMNNEKEDVAPKMKEKTSAAAIFFAIFLVLVAMLTAELFLFDINRHFNNNYQVCNVENQTQFTFQKAPAPEGCDMKEYEGLRVIIHIIVLIPFIVTGFILIMLIRHKQLSTYYRILRNAFIILMCWLTVRMIGEIEYYLIKHDPVIGKYVILLTIISLLIYLVILIQRRYLKRPL